jgi:DNA repair photolyase
MIVREITARGILTKSKVYDYAVNPYVGCQHGCTYCYARFMKRYSGHREPWGEFVDVKMNAPDLLRPDLSRKKTGRVWVSGVCDPYQPVEVRYRLTRRCLEILVAEGWPVTVQTRSPLVLRDLDVLRSARSLEAGMTVTTADDDVRRLFEPGAPPIQRRIRALGTMHDAGICTYAMIAPLLPGVEGLPALLRGKVDYVLVDRMNYHHGDWVYRKYHLEAAMGDDFFTLKTTELASLFTAENIECRVTYDPSGR